MDWIRIAELVATITALVGAAAALYKARALTPEEVRDKRADIAAKYESMANRQARINEEQAERIDKLEARIDKLEAELEDRDKLIADWAEGIKRLTYQLQANGLTPVWSPKLPEESN